MGGVNKSMNKKLVIGWVVALTVSTLISLSGYYIGSLLGGVDGLWMAILLGYLSMSYFIEALKTLKGKKPFWSYLSKRDKIALTFSMIIFFIFLIYPVKEGKDSEILGISFLAGITLAGIIFSTFATEDGKERIFFFLKQKKKNEH